MKQPTLSLILPMYNEIKNLQKGVVDKVINYAKSNKQIVEVLLVDDGSTDDSVNIIKKEYLGHYPKIRLYQKAHSGKAFTVMEGIKEAKGEYVLFMDIDLATPVEETDKFIPYINEGYDIVIGSRSKTREGAPLTRKVMAYGAIVVRNLIIGLRGIRDTQCGFKAFRKKTALHIIDNLVVFRRASRVKGSAISAAFDMEFLFLGQKYGYKIKEIPVVWRHVETKNVNFIKDSLETLKDIMRMKYYDLTNKYKSKKT